MSRNKLLPIIMMLLISNRWLFHTIYAHFLSIWNSWWLRNIISYLDLFCINYELCLGVHFTPARCVEAPIDLWSCPETCGEPLTISFHYMSVHWFPINVSLDKKAFSNDAPQYRVYKCLIVLQTTAASHYGTKDAACMLLTMWFTVWMTW